MEKIESCIVITFSNLLIESVEFGLAENGDLYVGTEETCNPQYSITKEVYFEV
jgi:hypothetical protein